MTYGLTVPLAAQTLWFLFSVLAGMFIMLVYVLMHELVLCFSLGRGGSAAADILFFLLLAAFEFCCTVFLPLGRMRWFYLVGQLLGGIVFRVVFAPIIHSILSALRKKTRWRKGQGKNKGKE